MLEMVIMDRDNQDLPSIEIYRDILTGNAIKSNQICLEDDFEGNRINKEATGKLRRIPEMEVDGYKCISVVVRSFFRA